MVQFPVPLAARREVRTAGTGAGVLTICSFAHVNSRWNPSGSYRCEIKTRGQVASPSLGCGGAIAGHRLNDGHLDKRRQNRWAGRPCQGSGCQFGKLTDAAWKAAQQAGCSDEQLADAFAYLGATVFAGYFLNYAQTDLDL
jgi:hypothetical protein